MAAPRTVRVAVEGCAHGELDRIYETLEKLQSQSSDGRPIDLLICCGDFQSVRSMSDLECLASPPKYRNMQSFYKYYSGEKKAPFLTIFIGGNHEAANHLLELPYGGWVAPGIWYMGNSGVVNFGGLRIGGISGIFKGYDLHTGYHESTPFDDDTLHSVNHQKDFDFWRLRHLQRPLDVMISHDWPEGVYRHGDTQALIRSKRHFEKDIARGALGSPPAMQLLQQLKPRYWFSGHLHCKFTATVVHGPAGQQQHLHQQSTVAAGSSESASSAAAAAAPPVTRFLALDKPLPRRDFLQVLDIPIPDDAVGAGEMCLHYDAEWLAIIAATHHMMPTTKRYPRLPQPGRISAEQVSATSAKLQALASSSSAAAVNESESDGGGSGAVLSSAASSTAVAVPCNFVVTSAPWKPGPGDTGAYRRVGLPQLQGNPQTDAFLQMMGLEHRITIPWGSPPGTRRPGASNSFDQSQHAAGEGSGAAGPAASAFGDGAGSAPASAASSSAIGSGLVPSSVLSHKRPLESAALSSNAAPSHVDPAEIDLDAVADTPTDVGGPAPQAVVAPAPAPVAAHADPAEIDLDAL